MRIAERSDSEGIAKVGRTAFPEAFGRFNTPENLSFHLNANYRSEVILSEMDKGSRYYLAEIGNEIVGFGKLRESQAPCVIPGSRPFEIHQIYLLEAFHRRGIGSRLMQLLIDKARDGGADGVFLGVYEKADWGIAFYKSVGFQKVGEHVFPVGDDKQMDWLMYQSLAD